MTLEVKDLHVSIEGKEILKGLSLTINTGEIHAIMGPNGTGKSTLAAVIMGNPKFEVTSGEILFDGQDVLEMSVDERSRAGIFLAMQYPYEIAGITNADFIKSALQARLGEDEHVSLFDFYRIMEKAVKDLQMDEDLPHRYVNEGFSGGERKRNEILQMKILQPKIAILDEIDSGLDIDALKIVGANIESMRSDNFGAMIITHYQRFLDYVHLDYVHILLNGVIVKSGDASLIKKIDKYGYDWLKDEFDIEDEGPAEKPQRAVLGACAVKKNNG